MELSIYVDNSIQLHFSWSKSEWTFEWFRKHQPLTPRVTPTPLPSISISMWLDLAIHFIWSTFEMHEHEPAYLDRKWKNADDDKKWQQQQHQKIAMHIDDNGTVWVKIMADN